MNIGNYLEDECGVDFMDTGIMDNKFLVKQLQKFKLIKNNGKTTTEVEVEVTKRVIPKIASEQQQDPITSAIDHIISVSKLSFFSVNSFSHYFCDFQKDHSF